MSAGNNQTGDKIRALDIEVRIPVEEGRRPVWADHPDEAGRWVRGIAEPLFREALDGDVQLGHAYADEQSFTQFLSVAATPSEANREIARLSPGELAERLRHDLAIKFDCTSQQPRVNIDADKGFMGRHSASHGHGSTHEHAAHAEEPAAAPRAPDPVFSAPPPRAEAPPTTRARATALLWMGAALGGSLIANAFLLWNVSELRAGTAEIVQLRDSVSKLTVDQKLTAAARTFEQAQCSKSIDEHRAMIADLAKRCTPLQPAPKPPPLPAPYPSTPNPYDGPR